MEKLKLNVESLAVESYATVEAKTEQMPVALVSYPHICYTTTATQNTYCNC